MEKKEIILLAVVIAFAAARLYQKYVKKGNTGYGQNSKPTGSDFPSSSKDDDYEPYAKK